jgi:hypothetical protein
VFVKSITRRLLMGQEGLWQIVENAVSKERFREYLRAAENDGDEALKLYQWNTEISSAFWGLLGHVEIALRNTIAARLRNYTMIQSGDGDWIARTLDNGVLRPSESNAVTESRRRVASNNKEVTYDQVLSELPFGFWATLLSRRYRNLWPELAGGFLGLSRRDSSELVRRVQEARWLRNRIGHHHRIWNLDLGTHHLGILEIARIIDPELGRWLSSVSTVDEIMSAAPRAAGKST